MKLSIVMATYNAEKYLSRALSSIFCQSYPNYEIIVQDGSSTDNTTAILNKHLPKTSWNSEPDSGVYDAWNKALDRVTGEWVIFLGADDCLLGEDVLVRCVHHLKRLPSKIAFAYGVLAKGISGEVQDLMNRSLLDAYRILITNMSIPFPATFVRASLVKEYKFDASYKIAGDFDFLAKWITHDNVARMPLVVSYMELGGLSSNARTKELLLAERGRILRKQVLPKAQELVLGCIKYYQNEDKHLEDVK